jgi:hypothetical protein
MRIYDMTKDKPTLTELLNKCDKNTSMPEDIKEWENMQPVGKEFGSPSNNIVDDSETDND